MLGDKNIKVADSRKKTTLALLLLYFYIFGPVENGASSFRLKSSL